MAYLIALIPALGWGFMPLITGKVGGSEANQIFGIGAGASLVGLVAFLIMHPQVSMKAFLFSLLCGALWSTAQVGQFVSFKRIGVSNTVPLSTVFQLVGNSIIGVLIFGEWHSARALTIGFIALAIVIIGAMMTSFTDRSNGQNVTTKDVLFLLAYLAARWANLHQSSSSSFLGLSSEDEPPPPPEYMGVVASPMAAATIPAAVEMTSSNVPSNRSSTTVPCTLSKA